MEDLLPNGPSAVIYVTGAPGTGKSTLVRALQARFSNVEVFSYGSRMAQHLEARDGPASPDTIVLRGGTDPFVTITDIRAVDRSMVDWVRDRQKGRVLLIDSHQVTLEASGLRFVPFESAVIFELQLTTIWLLSAAAGVIVKRIELESMGRIVPTIHEAEVHAAIQNSVAVEYAVHKGIELRVLNSGGSVAMVLDEAIKCLNNRVTD